MENTIGVQGVPARQNPFAVCHMESIPYRFEYGDWNTQLADLKRLNYRAAIVGKRGRGKTTLLEQLAERLVCTAPVNFTVVPHSSRQHRAILNELLNESIAGSILLVDGIERFSYLRRRQLFGRSARSGGLVVTSHRKCFLPTWVRCETSIETLHYTISRLPTEHSESLMEKATELFMDHDGNIRDVLRSLYDEYAIGRSACTR